MRHLLSAERGKRFLFFLTFIRVFASLLPIFGGIKKCRKKRIKQLNWLISQVK